MKAIATLALLFSLPVSHFAPRPAAALQGKLTASRPQKGGKWYLAASGHAVYCYGPVVMVPSVQSGIQRITTFCKGDQTMVQLRD